MKNRIAEYFIALVIFFMLIYFASKLKDQSDNRPAGIIQTTNLSAQLQSDSTAFSTKSEFTSKRNTCHSESEIIKNSIEIVRSRVLGISKAYSELRIDDIEWGKFIKNWNVDIQKFRDFENKRIFQCYKNSHFKNMNTHLTQLGVAYAFDNKEKIKFHENAIQENITFLLACMPEIKKYSDGDVSLPSYSIVTTKCDQSKCVTDVKIQRRMTKYELSLLSRTIRAEVHANGRFHIFYYLPEMVVDNGAWARVDFNPELSIAIFGKSLDDEQNLIEQVKKIDSYIGLWEDDQMDKDVIYRIRIDNKLGLIIELVSASNPSESSVIAEVIKSKYGDKIKLTDKDNSRGEYYIIEKNNNISVYDKQGYVFTLRMLKYHGF